MIAQRRANYAGYRTRELYVAGVNGPTTILLHGFGDSADCWRPALARLAASGRPAVAMDLPGFGEADPLADGPRLPQWDRFVAAVIFGYGINRAVVVVGNSLGGLLTVRAAETERALPIRGILALGTAGTGWTRPTRWATVGNLAVISALAALPVPPPLWRLWAALTTRALVRGALRGADPVHVRALSQHFATRGAARLLVSAAVSLLPEINSVAAIRAIGCPVIIAHGLRDRLVSVSAARRLQAMIPDSQLVLLPSSGHCPQVDDPARVVALAEELATGRPQYDRKVR